MPLHRFTVQPHEAAPLNAELARLASGLAQSERGVGKTNLGGWQSDDELFDGTPSACCVMLRSIASAALDEAQAYHTRHTARTSDTGAPLKEEHRSSHASHASHAWLNVNRGGDSNEMHTHDARRWSAVYFVTDLTGETAPTSGATSDLVGADLGGHLIFRAGGIQGSSHSFLPVPPEPGTLWLFPGSFPHCVLPFISSDEERTGGGDQQAHGRISVAINFDDEGASPPAMIPR